MVLRTASNREALCPLAGLARPRYGPNPHLDGRRAVDRRRAGGHRRGMHAGTAFRFGAMDAARSIRDDPHRSMSWVCWGRAPNAAPCRAPAPRRRAGDQARGHLEPCRRSLRAATAERDGDRDDGKGLCRPSGRRERVPASLVRIEARRARGKNPTVLPGHSRRRALARVLPRLEERIRARVLVLADLAARVAVMAARIRRAAYVGALGRRRRSPIGHPRGTPAPRSDEVGRTVCRRGERRPSRDAGPLLVVLVDEACPGALPGTKPTSIMRPAGGRAALRQGRP